MALAEKDADLADYRAALERGTIEGDDAFAAGLDALPDESLGLVWVDMAVLTDELSPLVEQATQEDLELGIDWLSASLSAEDDGMLVAMGARTPAAATRTTSRRSSAGCPPMRSPRSPSAAPRGRSTGSRARSTSTSSRSSLEELTGVSLDGIVEALSGEGVLYVRPGETFPTSRSPSRRRIRTRRGTPSTALRASSPPETQSEGDDDHRERPGDLDASRSRA